MRCTLSLNVFQSRRLSSHPTVTHQNQAAENQDSLARVGGKQAEQPFASVADSVDPGSKIGRCSVRICPCPSPMWATKRSNDFTSVKSLADYHVCERP